ncbi:unnamed protein product, partial [Durusdinium trenchii]
MSKLDDHADLSTALRSHHLGTASPAASTSASAPENQTRTLASPEWGTNPPINIRRKLALTPLPTSGFESSTETIASADLARVQGVKICVGKDNSVWLRNVGSREVDIPDDRTLLALDKHLRTVADIFCDVAKHRGVSEEGNNRMLQYRYTVSCNPMVNAFVAKDLGNDTERINMRAAQLGGCLSLQ